MRGAAEQPPLHRPAHVTAGGVLGVAGVAAVPGLRSAVNDLTEAELDLFEEMVLQQAAIERLSDLVQYLWPILEPGTPLEWNWNLDRLCDALQRQIEGDPAYQNLVVCVPPGTMKSLLVAVFAPAWEWLHYPHRRKIFFSNDDELAKRDSRRTRDLLRSEAYKRLLAIACGWTGRKPWIFAHDQNEKTNFENSDKGFRQCRSIDAKVVGKRGDDWVVDDPVDTNAFLKCGPDRRAAILKDVNTTIEKVLPSRVNLQAKARKTIVMQRLDPDDPAGRHIRKGWKVIQFSMEFNPDNPYNDPQDPRKVRGEPLYPPTSSLFPTAKLEELKQSLGLIEWNGQYNQEPSTKEGGQIRREWFRERWRGDPRELAKVADEVVLSSDAAKKNTEGADFHSLQVWARVGGKRYLLDRVCRRMAWPEYEAAMLAMIARWRPYLTACLIEDTANGTTFMQVHATMIGLPLLGFVPQRDAPGTDKSKAGRAIYLEQAAQAGLVILPDPEHALWPWQDAQVTTGLAYWWVEELLDVWCAFPVGTHDDDVDAASQLMIRWTRPQVSVEDFTDLLATM